MPYSRSLLISCFIYTVCIWGFPSGSAVKNLPAMQEMQVWSLGQEETLEEGIATHSRIIAWRIPWTEEPGGLPSMRSQRVRHDWSDLAHTHAHHVYMSVQIPNLRPSPFLFSNRKFVFYVYKCVSVLLRSSFGSFFSFHIYVISCGIMSFSVWLISLNMIISRSIQKMQCL